MCESEAKESPAQTSRPPPINDKTHRTLPAIKDILPPVIKKKRTRHILPPIRDFNSSSLPLTSPDTASEFTLFPQLIPELRLMIWQLAAPLPSLRGKLLYSYQKGCWIFEDLGLQPDPNGEDLWIRFDTTRLQPLQFALPLYSVNREARNVVLKWLREQNLTATRNSSSSVYEALRPFDPQRDTMFVPSTKLKAFVKEPAKALRQLGNMVERYFGNSNPALPRLAVTRVGLQLLRGRLLSTFFLFGGTIQTILVVDNASIGSLQALESKGGGRVVKLADSPVAKVTWSFLGGLGEVSGDDEGAKARLKEYMEGFDIMVATPTGYELEVQLVNLA